MDCTYRLQFFLALSLILRLRLPFRLRPRLRLCLRLRLRFCFHFFSFFGLLLHPLAFLLELFLGLPQKLGNRVLALPRPHIAFLNALLRRFRVPGGAARRVRVRNKERRV